MERFFGSWTSSVNSSSDDPSVEAQRSAELEQFNDAMNATNLIMSDEIDLAESKLEMGRSLFHVVR